MPIHLASAAIEGLFSWETYPTLVAGVLGAAFLKQWSAGIDLLSKLDNQGDTAKVQRELKSRDLHGTVALVIGGFTSQGLLVCSQLSSLGAQLILLTPSLRSERVLQMVHLLRDGTSNPLIYAAECDITNLASIEAFAAQWNLGEGKGGAVGGVGAGPAGGISGSTGLGVGLGNKSEESDTFQPRRVDSVVFMPIDESRHNIGSAPRETSEGTEYGYAEILGRFHLVNLLLPSLLLLPPHRDIRIISLVSPWYAAGIHRFDLKNLELEGRSFPSFAPWLLDGVHTLLWVALSRELQRRIQLMADADKRPRTKLPGLDEQGKPAGFIPTNVNLINICAGFERGRDVIDYLLPMKRVDLSVVAWEEEERTEENSLSDNPVDRQSATHTKLRNFLNQKTHQKTTQPLQTKSKARETVVASPSSFSQHLALQVISIVRWTLAIVMWPFIWLLAKSPKRSAGAVTWGAIAPIYAGDRKVVDSVLSEAGTPILIPGELHREGQIVRAASSQHLLPHDDTIWEAVEARAKEIVAAFQQSQQSRTV